MMMVHPTWIVSWQQETGAKEKVVRELALRVSDPNLEGLLSTLRLNGVKAFNVLLDT